MEEILMLQNKLKKKLEPYIFNQTTKDISGDW